MRSYPEDEWDRKELEDLKAESWMVELLKLNPSYTGWGPHEDYMWKRGESEGPDEFGRVGSSGWESRILCKSWKEMEIKLDDLNEVVHFYFQLDRETKECIACGNTGYHPDCEGKGCVYIEPSAHVNLILWLLHPRKGCSRGVEIKNIKQEELPEVFQFLREAATRNAERFSKLPS